MKRFPVERMAGSLALAAILAATVAFPAVDGPEPSLAGRVLDPLGGVIDDVEVRLWTAPVTTPVAVALTGADGTFRLPGVVPGLYRIAALKDGYAAHVSVVDTRARQWIGIVLRPGSSDAAREARASDPAWELRLPRRSILREIEAIDLASAAASPEEGEGPPSDGVRVQLDQMFRVGADAGDADGAERVGSQGNETSLRLASAIGQRGSVRVQGRHRDLAASDLAGAPDPSARRESSALGVAFSYDAGVDQRLAMRAHYAQDDLRWGAALPAPLRHEQRDWGYSTEWSKQLDDASRIALEIGFRDTLLQLGGDSPLASPVGAPATPEVNQQRLGAAGHYASLPAEDHQVQVDFSATLLRAPAPPPASLPGLPLDSELTLGLAAQGTWFVAGPLSLDYGLGYRHSAALQDLGVVEPRIGGAWTSGDVALRVLVSYNAVTSFREPDGAFAGYARPVPRIGYEADVEVPIARGLRIKGGTRYAPLELAFEGFEPEGLPGATQLAAYRSNGDVSLETNRLALVQETQNVQTSVEFLAGEAEGLLSSSFPWNGRFALLAERTLRVRQGRLGVHLAPLGTRVQVDYRELDEAPLQEESVAASGREESLELRVTQDLLRDTGFGYWRVLMALRTASVESPEDAPWNSSLEPTPPRTRNHGVSAGVSVIF